MTKIFTYGYSKRTYNQLIVKLNNVCNHFYGVDDIELSAKLFGNRRLFEEFIEHLLKGKTTSVI